MPVDVGGRILAFDAEGHCHIDSDLAEVICDRFGIDPLRIDYHLDDFELVETEEARNRGLNPEFTLESIFTKERLRIVIDLWDGTGDCWADDASRRSVYIDGAHILRFEDRQARLQPDEVRLLAERKVLPERYKQFGEKRGPLLGTQVVAAARDALARATRAILNAASWELVYRKLQVADSRWNGWSEFAPLVPALAHAARPARRVLHVGGGPVGRTANGELAPPVLLLQRAEPQLVFTVVSRPTAAEWPAGKGANPYWPADPVGVEVRIGDDVVPIGVQWANDRRELILDPPAGLGKDFTYGWSWEDGQNRLTIVFEPQKTE